MTTKVKLRQTGKIIEVPIGLNKPTISSTLIKKWESILNTISEIANIPSALIMNIDKEQLKCSAINTNKKHPYSIGDGCNLQSGLYCETVIGTNAYLEINNALLTDKWKDNPDVELGMIAYSGLPLLWPDNEFYGTICGLDYVEIKNKETLKKLLFEFKKLVEEDLYNLLLLRDYNKVKDDNHKLNSKINSLDNINKEYKESLLQSNFLKRISHSFITPVTTIQGLSDFGKTEAKDENIKDYFSKISKSSDYLLILFNDIIDYKNLENNKLLLKHQNTNLKEIINTSIDLVDDLFKEKNIELIKNESLEDIFIYADENRIIQILINLLSNAATFTKKGGNTLIKANLLSSHEQFLFVEITISDNGIGMSQEFQRIMYEPFAKERSSDLINNGAGLGLPIVKSLVDLMNGSIRCNSTLKKGTTFKLNFAFNKAVGNNSTKNKTLIEKCDYEKITILLAEDNEINSKIVSKILERKHISVKIVNDGLKAYNEIKRNPNTYDLILMDINMPKMNGYISTKKIREEGYKNPIIALSANSNTDDIEEGLKYGIDSFLAKPIDINKLLNTISFFNNLVE